jgi:riboflavin-specific deaminase-like protein
MSSDRVPNAGVMGHAPLARGNGLETRRADAVFRGPPEDTWACVPDLFRQPGARLPPPWDDLFGPLRKETPGELVVVAQIGQSLDGRIATASGHSHYINGTAGRAHLHRLRALVDAVVVGVGTVVADDPQLTVRLVQGPHPARVVLDPQGRIPDEARVLASDGVRRLVVTTSPQPSLPPGVETLVMRPTDGHIPPAAILEGLAQRGLRRILVEGGAATVSRFLAAGCLDRLHLLVAPIIIGAGPTGLALPPIERIDGAWRPPIRVHRLDEDVLFDCDLSGHKALPQRAGHPA